MNTVEVTCPRCSNEISVEGAGKFSCPHCGQSLELDAPALPAKVAPQNFAPLTFQNPNELFNKDGAIVTRSQILGPGLVVSIPNISAVSRRVVSAKRTIPILSLLVGFIFALSQEWIAAAIFGIPALILLIVRRDKYAVILHSGGDEFSLTFKHSETANEAAFAVSQAMEGR